MKDVAKCIQYRCYRNLGDDWTGSFSIALQLHVGKLNMCFRFDVKAW